MSSDMHNNGWITQPGVVTQEVGGVNPNRPGIIFPSQSRSNGTFNSDPIFNPNAKGIRLFITNDAAGGSTATVKIQVQNPLDATAAGGWTDLAGATSAALAGVTGSIVTIYPGLTGIADAAGVTINQHLGSRFRIVLTTTIGAATASVGADFLL